MLELKEMSLQEGRWVALRYTTRHNTGRLRTTLEQDLELRVDTETGKVMGKMHITELEADSIDGAREKMALWCERLAAGLRGAVRQNSELPLFERRRFNLAEQPLWLQQEFARLVQAYATAETTEDHERIKLWLTGHPMNMVGDMVERAQYEAETFRETCSEHPE